MSKTSEMVMATTRLDREYKGLLTDIVQLLEQARHTAARSINTILTTTYWEIGRRIVEFEQKGERRAEYGRELLKRLSKDFTTQFGRGFSERNIEQMRLFYINWPISQTLSAKSPRPLSHRRIQTLSGESNFKSSRIFSLPWSHYVRLMALEDKDKRDFYEEEARRAGWSVRQLDRQINSMLYERVALSKKKGELLKKAENSKDRVTAEEAIKDPYVLEFLGLPEPISERHLENALIQHLADFLLELGYGFTFVARQKRLQIGSESYYLDLLFFHRGLRCLIAIDLKVGKFTHADAGQMNLYLNYLLENEKMEDENDPVGLILCSEKDEAVAHYALGRLTNKIFSSRYKLQLPDPEILKREIEAERRRLEMRLLNKN
jgi:predicted nuclease of restriction endonuclease-like (RecB) superfamily